MTSRSFKDDTQAAPAPTMAFYLGVGYTEFVGNPWVEDRVIDGRHSLSEKMPEQF